MRGKIGFISRAFDGESFDFGETIAAVFKEAGWQLASSNRTLLVDLPGAITLIGTATDSSLAPIGELVAAALRKIGLNCRPEEVPRNQIGGALEPNTLYVVIGRK